MNVRRTIAFGLITAWLACAGCVLEKPPAPKGQEAIPVEVSKVKLQDLYRILEFVGDIKGQEEATAYPKVTGKIVEKVKEEGNEVLKGDVIVMIDRDEVGLTFRNAPVESPLTGVIGRVYVDIGTSVTPQTPVALIVDMDTVRVVLDIPETYLPGVHLGQETEIKVDAYPQETFMGKVNKISPVLDLSTRSAPIEIVIDNPRHRLRSGMFAKVHLVIEGETHVPAVLREAIIGKSPDTYVFVIQDNKASMKKVKTGISQGPLVAITQGIDAGDLVVIRGQQKLYEGASVLTEE